MNETAPEAPIPVSAHTGPGRPPQSRLGPDRAPIVNKRPDRPSSPAPAQTFVKREKLCQGLFTWEQKGPFSSLGACRAPRSRPVRDPAPKSFPRRPEHTQTAQRQRRAATGHVDTFGATWTPSAWDETLARSTSAVLNRVDGLSAAPMSVVHHHTPTPVPTATPSRPAPDRPTHSMRVVQVGWRWSRAGLERSRAHMGVDV